MYILQPGTRAVSRRNGAARPQRNASTSIWATSGVAQPAATFSALHFGFHITAMARVCPPEPRARMLTSK